MTPLREAALRFLTDFDDLVSQSRGVAGLHLNGDVAPWDELLLGGQFEHWLHSVAALRSALDSAPAREGWRGLALKVLSELSGGSFGLNEHVIGRHRIPSACPASAGGPLDKCDCDVLRDVRILEAAFEAAGSDGAACRKGADTASSTDGAGHTHSPEPAASPPSPTMADRDAAIRALALSTRAMNEAPNNVSEYVGGCATCDDAGQYGDGPDCPDCVSYNVADVERVALAIAVARTEGRREGDRSGSIRTSDPLPPKQVTYQTGPRSDGGERTTAAMSRLADELAERAREAALSAARIQAHSYSSGADDFSADLLGAKAAAYRDAESMARAALSAEPVADGGPREEACPRARSSMTPCVVRHGNSAATDDGRCAGCDVAVAGVAGAFPPPASPPRGEGLRWTPVTERLPDGGARVLVYGRDLKGFATSKPRGRDLVTLATWLAAEGWFVSAVAGRLEGATHWMPLPAGPLPEPAGTTTEEV